MNAYRVICPLYNFSVLNLTLIPSKNLSRIEIAKLLEAREKEVAEGIEVFNGVKIKRISKEDHKTLESSFFALPPDTKLRPSMFVLEKEITVKGELDYPLDTIMQNIVLAMRLLKKGYVSGNSVFYIPISEVVVNMPPFRLIEWTWLQQRKLEIWGGLPYALGFDDFQGLKRLVQKIQNIDFVKRKDLRLACGRFQRAYEEDNFEDQLIDIMIAFESLFLKGEKGNVPHGKIIAVGCSCLLGSNEEQREEIEFFLTEAYRIRNSVVHGSEYAKPKIKKEYEIYEFVSRVEEYLRESLKKLLD
jgi:hypothetical protein